MIGYAVRVAELEKSGSTDMMFVETAHAEQNYPVPAAYGAYAGYMNLRLGQEKYEEAQKDILRIIENRITVHDVGSCRIQEYEEIKNEAIKYHSTML